MVYTCKTIEESLITRITRILLFWHFRIARIELNVIERTLNGNCWQQFALGATACCSWGPRRQPYSARASYTEAKTTTMQSVPSQSQCWWHFIHAFLPRSRTWHCNFGIILKVPSLRVSFLVNACSTYLLQWKAARYISVLRMTRTDYIFYSD